jgi:ABC-type phosphate transport system substrate-binding protein
VRKKRLLLAASIGIAAVGLIGGNALADPSGAPTFRDLAGVGSVTTQNVMNGFSDAIVVNGNKVLGSYDGTGSPQISTKDPATSPACTINRPSGSGNGVNALIASMQANDGCLQFARSSANNSASHPGAGLTYIPFAVDAVAYAIRSDSTISKRLTVAQLQAVYNCNAATLANFKPLLPQFGSGTRQFFLQQLGFTDTADFVTQPTHTCVSQVDTTGAPLVENTGTLITDPKNIVPYSIADWLAQTNGTVQDVHGKTILGQINGIAPTVLNTSSVNVRDVYNVIPTAQEGNAPYSTIFVGPNSLICTNSNLIKNFGFAPNTNCGSTAIRTP